MMKKNGVCILILAVIMLAIPAFLVTFIKGGSGFLCNHLFGIGVYLHVNKRIKGKKIL